MQIAEIIERSAGKSAPDRTGSKRGGENESKSERHWQSVNRVNIGDGASELAGACFFPAGSRSHG